ncbi:hypothetical protein PoB_006090200 [Plakobranchus ocellatus]|uniref:Uncharacterized protein n=1 Tax=Plakobranchus ocellatus TaxID=259542 RepID=A0AAV4CR86_9GAST|nr:hypothetical protein PoB_006090200 [Plakobranchus ocellatus]
MCSHHRAQILDTQRKERSRQTPGFSLTTIGTAISILALLTGFYALAWPSSDGGFKPRTRPHSKGKFASHCTTIARERREEPEGGGVGIFERQRKGSITCQQEMTSDVSVVNWDMTSAPQLHTSPLRAVTDRH